MKKIAITGGYGSGKTTALYFILGLNYPCISIDNILHTQFSNIIKSNISYQEKIQLLKPKILNQISELESNITSKSNVLFIEVPIGVFKYEYNFCKSYFTDIIYIHTEKEIRKLRLPESRKHILETVLDREIDVLEINKDIKHILMNNADKKCLYKNLKHTLSSIIS